MQLPHFKDSHGTALHTNEDGNTLVHLGHVGVHQLPQALSPLQKTPPPQPSKEVFGPA